MIKRLDGEWSVYLDEASDWSSVDPLPLDHLPVQDPSGGWKALERGQQIAIPASTVDVAPGYHGVSWWSTEVDAGGDAGLIIRFGGARLLAEVFWDRKRIAVDLEGLTPFEARVPRNLATRGKHRLDLRVTNPGGSNTWDDIRPVEWGHHQFPAGHDFGGPWQPVWVEELRSPRVADLWVRPNRELSAALVDIELEADEPAMARIAIFDPSGDVAVETDALLNPGRNHLELRVESPSLYGPGSPSLYKCGIDLADGRPTCEKTFGFRLLDVVDGQLVLNGGAFRLASAISWGHYRRGPVPSEGDVEREAESVLSFGHNTFSAHRFPSTPELQEALERRGLLLYQEPGSVGGPLFATCRIDQRENVTRFAMERLRRLARRDRSSPSLVWWNLANEWTSPDMAGWPDYVDSALSEIRAHDDSRLVTFTSGWGESPMLRPFSSERETSWDYHRVYMWPNVWHDAVRVAITAPAPPRPMLTLDGESTCFTTLGRVRKIAESFDGDEVEGSAKQRWSEWLRKLETGLAQIDPGGALGGADGFCEQTARVQAHSFARLVEAHRRDTRIHGLVLNGWHQHHIVGTSGIVAPDRSPGIDPTPIRRANAETALAFKELPRAMESGGTYEVTVDVIIKAGSSDPGPFRLWFGGNKVDASATPKVSPSNRGLVEVRAERGELIVEDVILVVEKQTAPNKEIALYDPHSELKPWLHLNGVRFREWDGNDEGPLLMAYRSGAGGMRLGEGRRAVVFERNRPHGYMPVDLGSAVAGVWPSGPDVPMLGGWIGGWAFSVNDVLPNLGPPGVWGSERHTIIPSRGVPGVRGRWIAGVCSFPKATIFDIGLPEFGAAAWIEETSGGEVLTTTLPLIERRDDLVGGAVLMDLLRWLAGEDAA